MEKWGACHACIKDSPKYGIISKQGIFKNGIQKKPEVATAGLSAISLPEIPTCPGHHTNSTDILDCSKENKNYLICRMRG